MFGYFEQYHFPIGGQNQYAWTKKLYGKLWSDQDVKAIAAQWELASLLKEGNRAAFEEI